MTLRDRQGLTLIELIVVITIVAVVLLVAIPSVGSWLGGDVRKAAREMGSVMQAAYDECALQHVPMRIAYNLDKHAYWVEAATGDVRLFQNQKAREDWLEDEEDRAEEIEEWKERDEQERDRIRNQQQDKLGDPESPLSGLMGFLGLSLGTGVLEAPQRLNEFEVLENEVIKPRELPHSVAFKGIWSPQWDDVVEPQDPPPEEEEEELILYTHIFPEGYMEDTVVYLVDRSESEISLIVEPLTGRIRVELGEADPPDREDRRVD